MASKMTFLVAVLLLLGTAAADKCFDAQAALKAANAVRQARALPTLRWSLRLEVAAQAWAEHLVDQGCVAESSGARGEAIFMTSDASADASFDTNTENFFQGLAAEKQGLLADSATEMGCAAGKGSKCTAVVCRFAPVVERVIVINKALESAEEGSDESSVESSEEALESSTESSDESSAESSEEALESSAESSDESSVESSTESSDESSEEATTLEVTRRVFRRFLF